jgi:hypothetical protein
VNRALAIDLEFDKLQTLVSAQAQTRLGRALLTTFDGLPPLAEAIRSARLTEAFDRLIDDDGRLSLEGVDDAVEWLEPGAPAPTEPSHLLALITLARRINTARARLKSGRAEVFSSSPMSRPEFAGTAPLTTRRPPSWRVSVAS